MIPLPRQHHAAGCRPRCAALLSGALQSLANWSYDHRDLARERLVDRAMELCWTGLDRLRVSAVS